MKGPISLEAQHLAEAIQYRREVYFFLMCKTNKKKKKRQIQIPNPSSNKLLKWKMKRMTNQKPYDLGERTKLFTTEVLQYDREITDEIILILLPLRGVRATKQS